MTEIADKIQTENVDKLEKQLASLKVSNAYSLEKQIDCAENYFKTKKICKSIRAERMQWDLPDSTDYRDIIKTSYPTSFSGAANKHFESAEFQRDTLELWHDWLSVGGNLLIYGIGSKIKLLQKWRDFVTQQLNETVIEIDGFNVNVKFDTIWNCLREAISDNVTQLPVKSNEQSLTRMCELIDELKDPLYLIVHSIDGRQFQSLEIQDKLSRLAHCNNLRIAASVDTCRVFLLWPHDVLVRFRWMSAHLPTFEAYRQETRDTLLGGRVGIAGGGARPANQDELDLCAANPELEHLQLNSLRVVMNSVQDAAREVFMLLVKLCWSKLVAAAAAAAANESEKAEATRATSKSSAKRAANSTKKNGKQEKDDDNNDDHDMGANSDSDEENVRRRREGRLEDYGVLIKDLFSECQKNLLAKTMTNLKTYLVEFRDHQLLVIRRNSKGFEVIKLLLTRNNLQHLIENETEFS